MVAGGGDSCMQGWFGRFACEEGLGSVGFSIFPPLKSNVKEKKMECEKRTRGRGVAL